MFKMYKCLTLVSKVLLQWKTLKCTRVHHPGTSVNLILLSAILCGLAKFESFSMWWRSSSWTSLSTRIRRKELPWPEWFVSELVLGHCTEPVVLRSLRLICQPRAYFRLDCSPEYGFWWRRLGIWRPIEQGHQRHQQSLFLAGRCHLWFDRG